MHGDTGYRFANFCNTLFVDAAQESRFSRVYRAFTGEVRDFGEVLLESRELVMTHSLTGELGSLAYLLHDIAQHDRRTRDFTRSRLRGALMEIVASFPVYRSYIGPRGVSDNDRRYIERAVDAAARRGLAGDASVLHFVRDVLLSAPGEPVAALRRLKLAFARRFQQFTAPVMAKSMEDTAFYRYNRLASLNEVGADPRSFGTTADDFHAASEHLSCSHPFGLLASSAGLSAARSVASLRASHRTGPHDTRQTSSTIFAETAGEPRMGGVCRSTNVGRVCASTTNRE